MKPAACDREAVALLACSALSAEAAAATERHLAACPACYGYLQELSALCTDHAEAARRLPVAQVSQRTYARVARATRGGRRSWPAGWLAGLGLRGIQVATAAVVGLLLAGSGLVMLRRPPTAASASVAVAPQAAPPSSLKVPSEATGSKLITYRLALNRSPEEFDRLLAREADRPSAAPVPTLRSGWAWSDAGF